MSSAMQLPEIVAVVLENLSDDKARPPLSFARLPSLGPPLPVCCAWSQPSLRALARVPAPLPPRIRCLCASHRESRSRLRCHGRRDAQQCLLSTADARGQVRHGVACPSSGAARRSNTSLSHISTAPSLQISWCSSQACRASSIFGFPGGIVAPDEVAAIKRTTPTPFAKLTDVALAAPSRFICAMF
jgi:hypothetical protein